MKKLATLLLVCVILSLCGCEDDAISQVNSKLLDANGNFSLWVSNQSFAIKNVDITVEIDGELVISEYFNVGTQHTFKEFKLALEPGTHHINIRSNNGKAELSKTFEFRPGQNGVIDYWYTKKSKYGDPIPRKFAFAIIDGTIQIM
jgi:hypothetical protein